MLSTFLFSVYEYAIYMHVKFYGVCIVGSLNGTRCKDGVKVLWSCSHLFIYFFFTVPSLHALVFIQKTFLELVPAVFCCCCCCCCCCCFLLVFYVVVCCCCCLLQLLLLLFVLLFRNSKREEAGGEAEGKMHGL